MLAGVPYTHIHIFFNIFKSLYCKFYKRFLSFLITINIFLYILWLCVYVSNEKNSNFHTKWSCRLFCEHTQNSPPKENLCFFLHNFSMTRQAKILYIFLQSKIYTYVYKNYILNIKKKVTSLILWKYVIFLVCRI